MKKYILTSIIFLLASCSFSNDIVTLEQQEQKQAEKKVFEMVVKNYNSETKTLDLSGQRLEELPRFHKIDEGVLLEVEKLDISDNRITSLWYRELDALPNLKYLDASDNEISIINAFKSEKVSLEYLDIRDNQLENDDLTKASKYLEKTLKTLYASGNNFSKELENQIKALEKKQKKESK